MLRKMSVIGLGSTKVIVHEIFSAYVLDIPDGIRQLKESECLRSKSRWEKVQDLPTTPAKTLSFCHPQEIPNISENESLGEQLFQACAIDADCTVNWMGIIRLFPLLF